MPLSAFEKSCIAQAVIKDCYWDYNITADDIIKITNSQDARLKQKLFDKILNNSIDKLQAIKLFAKEELQELFDNAHIFKKYNFDKRYLCLRNIFLQETNKIESLEWRKR